MATFVVAVECLGADIPPHRLTAGGVTEHTYHLHTGTLAHTVATDQCQPADPSESPSPNPNVAGPPQPNCRAAPLHPQREPARR